MAVTYYEEYSAKKLNQVVLLGSHDAGITKGNANTRTQNKDIYEQAVCGARFFDVRIAAFYDTLPGGAATMSTYHDATKVKLPGSKKGMTVHTTVLGKAGEELNDVLKDARRFVQAHPNEFLMLKFDKSENWPQIAEACIDVLDDWIYAPKTDEAANINQCTLDELKGKVVVLFTQDGWDNCGVAHNARRGLGILKWANLYSKTQSSARDYHENFCGLQYYGKGGVSAGTSGTEAKIRVNKEEQEELMKGQGRYKTDSGRVGRHYGDQINPQVVGLMYWTTTGMSFHGIKARNKKMWSTSNQNLLVAATGFALDGTWGHVPDKRAFMPNIIMVDFVNTHKGQLVKALNTKNAGEINEIINEGARI